MRKNSVKNLLLGGGLLASLIFLVLSLRGSSSGPTPLAVATVAPTAKATTSSSPLRSEERSVQAAPEEAGLDRYQVVLTRNIFSPPAPRPDEGRTIKVVQNNMRNPIVIPPVHPEPPQPTPGKLDNWQFAGYFVDNGVPTGVLQNDADGTWFFKAAGDTFLNYKVEKVSTKDHGEIVLVCGRTRQSLKPTPDFSLVPLQGASAPPPTATPNPPRPGGGMGPGPGGMGPGRMMGPGGMPPGMNPGMRRGG